MFVDKAEITVKAGNGGNGKVSFHREKYVSAGGPDGGDGGRGGSIIVRVDTNMSTLMDFRYKRKYAASNGADGTANNKKGKDGKDLEIRVPDGTIIRDVETGAVIIDMSNSTGEKTFKLARGGTGGWGNQHFATPTRQAPRFAKAGLPGEELDIVLELKLLADVGLIGYPNVGKSTLLSVVSKAHPKIADYHFTTLFPNLGVVYVSDGNSFTMADIPGIIEGASDGAGLGHDFLRHIDRCRLLVHIVDISGSEGRNPIEDFKTINDELKKYNSELAERPQIVVANKCDLVFDGITNKQTNIKNDEFNQENAEETNPVNLATNFEKYITEHGYKLFKISAATHAGVQDLINYISHELKNLPPVVHYESDYVPKQKIQGKPEDLVIENYDDVWTIEGAWIERLMQNINFSDYESRMFFDKVLRNAGVFKRLEEMGIKSGDTISIYNIEFEYEE